ncbi:hypothetical protein GCM10009827_038920 [Dactylosporangium maewongense]|uniref:Uncharacterized protein n=1 Tax=Dactylosporangium maewongense TaxID=634393 RepID=A0ABP4LAH5_9ACTN
MWVNVHSLVGRCISSDADRREANFRVLRTLVPWTVFNITGQLLAPLLVHSLL